MMFSVTLRAQTCSYTENSDGSRDFRCPDGRYLGMTRQQLDDIQIKLNNGQAAERTVEKLNTIVAEKDKQLATKDETIAEAQKVSGLQKQIADSLRADVARFQGLFISERELRREAVQFVPHGNKTKLDKFLAFFDHPSFQFAIKGFAPIWTAVRCQ